MNAARFHNALRILLSLGQHDLAAAGVIDSNWGSADGFASDRDQVKAFMSDPVSEAVRMPDANFDRLAALLESRQPALPPVTGPYHGPALVDQLRLIGALAGTSDKRGHQDQRDTVAYVETVTADMLAALKALLKVINDARADEAFDASTCDAGGIIFGDIASEAVEAASAAIAKAEPPAPVATSRPGDQAAVYAEETGVDYATALVRCNMD